MRYRGRLRAVRRFRAGTGKREKERRGKEAGAREGAGRTRRERRGPELLRTVRERESRGRQGGGNDEERATAQTRFASDSRVLIVQRTRRARPMRFPLYLSFVVSRDGQAKTREEMSKRRRQGGNGSRCEDGECCTESTGALTDPPLPLPSRPDLHLLRGELS
jgi:hypothetical protein